MKKSPFPDPPFMCFIESSVQVESAHARSGGCPTRQRGSGVSTVRGGYPTATPKTSSKDTFVAELWRASRGVARQLDCEEIPRKSMNTQPWRPLHGL